MDRKNKIKGIKNLLGEQYSFEQLMSEPEVSYLKMNPPENFSERLVATLTAGCLDISAVLYKTGGALQLGYDVFVKDNPDSTEWICYENIPDQLSFSEEDMLDALDNIVEENGLSYTECPFTRFAGKELSSDRNSQKLDL